MPNVDKFLHACVQTLTAFALFVVVCWAISMAAGFTL